MKNINEMNMEELEARQAEISKEIASADAARIAELDQEVDQIAARKKELAAAEQRQSVLDKIAGGSGRNVRSFKPEKDVEVRNTPEYIKAYAEAIKSGDDSECRALLSTNVTGGTIPVPEVVEGYIRQAWERDEITRRVRKTYIRGNVKVGFEISATGAVVHTEGAAAPAEEDLVIGVVSLNPVSIKKWITISDEVMDLSGEEFLEYIYDEITYQIAKKLAADLIADVVAAPATATATAPAVPVVNAPTLELFTPAYAMAQLSDNASDIVFIMSRGTYAEMKALQLSAAYATDPFEGREVLFTSELKDYGYANIGDTVMIVGDLNRGLQANFPNGEEVKFKFDDLSLAEKDLVKIVGRMFVGHGVVESKALVKVNKS